MNDWLSLVLGALASEGLKLLIAEAKMVLAFKSVSNELASDMEFLLPVITQIESLQDVMELQDLKDMIVEALVVVEECSRVKKWNILLKSKYTTKLWKSIGRCSSSVRFNYSFFSLGTNCSLTIISKSSIRSSIF